MGNFFLVMIGMGVFYSTPTRNGRDFKSRLITLLVLSTFYLIYYLTITFSSLSSITVTGILACLVGVFIYPINLIGKKQGRSTSPNYVTVIGTILFISGGIYIFLK